MSKSVTVDKAALREILAALIGPPHLIRELQATRCLGDSPIDLLVEQFNAAVANGQQEASHD